MPDLDILTLPVVPLTQGVVLPSMVVTIALETDEAKAAYEAAADGGRLLLVPQVDGTYARVGVVAQIESSGALPSRRTMSAVVFGGTVTSTVNAVPFDNVQATAAVPYGVSCVAAADVRPGPGRGSTRSRR